MSNVAAVKFVLDPVHTLGVCMSMTTVLRGSKVKSHAWVQKSIIGWDSTVGKWV